MRALVAVKRVIDYAAKIRVKADKRGVEMAGVKMSMNPFCEIALEEAVRLRERGDVSEVVAVSLGTKQCTDTLRTALAIGADRGVLVQTEDSDWLEPLTVAKLLQRIVQREDAQLLLLGKQAIDDDSNQTGQMAAALLSWPQATFASKVVVDKASGRVRVTREIDDGADTVDLELPAVITVDLRLNEPRYATLPNIMKAKKKPITTLTPVDLGVPLEQGLRRVELLKVEEPPPRKAGIIVASVDELLQKLRQEAKLEI